jgi:ribosome assembly protein YihI (activator of Der GTPase)
VVDLLLLPLLLLQLDMHFLKQRPDFQEKFNFKPESAEDEEQQSWRRKTQSELDAEAAQRRQQLAAASAAAAAPQAPADSSLQQSAKAWSIRWRW